MERLRQLLQDGIAFLQALLWPAVNSVRGNVGLAALSVVLAFALWIFVTDTENPTRSGVLPIDVEVEPVSVPNDVALTEPLETVRIRVQVAADVWDSLTTADFKATVDMDGLQPGSYDLPVRVRTLTGRGGLRVTQVIPDRVAVELESLFSKSVPVTVELAGAASTGYEARDPRSDQETVLVTGPQSRVSLVTQAVATVDLTGRTDVVQQAVRLEPRDDRGFLVEGVSVEPAVVEVSVSIQQTQFARALVVSPALTGAPAAGYNLAAVSVDPAVVTVFGSREFIEQATTIRTHSINIEGVAADVVRTVSLDLPAGASVSGGSTVTVTVDVAPAQGQRVLGVTVGVTGLASDLQVAGALPTVQVTLLGELPTLLKLSPGDVVARVDLSGLGAGTHPLIVGVSVPAGATLAATSPDRIEIVLEQR